MKLMTRDPRRRNVRNSWAHSTRGYRRRHPGKVQPSSSHMGLFWPPATSIFLPTPPPALLALYSFIVCYSSEENKLHRPSYPVKSSLHHGHGRTQHFIGALAFAGEDRQRKAGRRCQFPGFYRSKPEGWIILSHLPKLNVTNEHFSVGKPLSGMAPRRNSPPSPRPLPPCAPALHTGRV